MKEYHSVPLLNHREPLLGLTITFLTISWIASLLRFYIRFVSQRSPGWDDFFIILTMLSTTIASVVLCIMTNIGLGQPVYSLTLAARQTILKTIYIVTATYPLSGAFVKAALLLQYLQYFHGKRIGLLCKSVLVLTVVSGLAFGACSWFSCYPVQSFWDFSVQNSRCWGFASRNQLEFMRISTAQVVISAALSLIVFLIPLWSSFRPGTKKTAQLSMIGLFLLGLCAIICSLWRAGFIIKLALVDGEEFDPVWDNPTVMGLASYEANLAAVCSALPVLWPVIKEKWNRIFVTYEVRVTEEYDPFPGSRGGATDLELQSTSSDRGVVMESHDSGWEPFVGDETTGLGKNTTVVQAPTSAKWPTKVKGVLLKA
ncbi:hypothetical protein C8A05DRAFT_31119 [Staphylotrichum tortipilum]|uniref:Rhodopsin domain-containing protein n=1 Tax=Staphylotrichum tortipilum TaxID=2831512 RepID=A0AAN6RWI3_9PEZI|nr:hypothetical protein C8A05DRAFT_31119 [Staphylotrichum longicolle]